MFVSTDSFLIMIFTDNTRYKVFTILSYKVKPWNEHFTKQMENEGIARMLVVVVQVLHCMEFFYCL